jgi:membrane protein DedA with SNARE-associated domain
MLEFIDTYIIPFFLDIYDAIGYVGVAIAVALETFIPIIPSEVIVPMAGWKVSQSAADPSVVEPLTQQPWSFIAVLIAATLGALAGSLAGYLIGAWGGRPLLDRWGRYVHIYPDDLDRADAWFERYGGWAVFFARLVPLLRALINYPAGIARMPLGRFLLFSTLGSLPWNAALILAGYLLGENYETLYEAIRPYELVIYAVVIIGGAYVIYRWARGRGSPKDTTPSQIEGEPDAG